MIWKETFQSEKSYLKILFDDKDKILLVFSKYVPNWDQGQPISKLKYQIESIYRTITKEIELIEFQSNRDDGRK